MSVYVNKEQFDSALANKAFSTFEEFKEALNETSKPTSLLVWFGLIVLNMAVWILAGALTASTRWVAGFIVTVLYGIILAYIILNYLSEGEYSKIGKVLWPLVPLAWFTGGAYISYQVKIQTNSKKYFSLTLLLISAIPQLIMSSYLYYRYFIPNLMFNFYAGYYAIVISFYMSIWSNDSVGKFVKWLSFYSSLCVWILLILLLWKEVLPGKHTDWLANLNSFVFFGAMHAVTEIPIEDAGYRWILYDTGMLVLGLLGLVTSERSPVVMCGLGLFMSCIQFSAWVADVFSDETMQKLTQFTILAAVGSAVIWISIQYSKRRKEIENWIQVNCFMQDTNDKANVTFELISES